MNSSAKSPQQIEKEKISDLRFPEEEVLKSIEAIQRRKLDLDRAASLGNIEHGKLRIIFEDSEGLKQVETTLWGVTDKRIILKQGNLIPIHRIHEVKI